MDQQRPVNWKQVWEARTAEIDERIVSAYARGSDTEAVYDSVRNFAQGSLGAGEQLPDCGPGSGFDDECRALFEEHLLRLEKSGKLKREGERYSIPQSADYEGANQIGAAAGGSGPRGAGLSGEGGHPDQWGRSGTATEPEQSGRAGEETPVETGEDVHRKTDRFGP
jgi:hypothetical protein